MDATTAVAIAGLLTTAAVGLGAPLITRRSDRERFDQEIQQSKLDELRTVVDTAAVELLKAHDLHVGAMLALRKWAGPAPEDVKRGTRVPGGPDPKPQVDAFCAHQITMLPTGYRLALRLGNKDPIVVAHEAAREPFHDAFEVFTAMQDDVWTAIDKLGELDALGRKAGERATHFLDACAAVLRP